MADLTDEAKDKIRAALKSHEQKCDDLYFQMKQDLAKEFNVDEEDVEDVWDEDL